MRHRAECRRVIRMQRFNHQSVLAFVVLAASVPLASAGEWALTEPRSAEQLRDGHDLVIVGKLDRPVRPPTIHDFRLERWVEPANGPDPKWEWEPLVFGEETEHVIETRKVKGGFGAVRLSLRPHTGRKMLRLAEPIDDNTTALRAAATLHDGARYRLTWTAHPTDGSDAGPLVTTFKIAESRLPAPREPTAGVAVAESAPWYLCELLFRDDDSNILFYGRAVVSRHGSTTRGTPAIGFDGGQYVPPPDPGYRRLRSHTVAAIARGLADGRAIFAPPADTTRYYQAVADRTGPTAIAEGDLGTSLPLPEKPNEVRYLVFVSAIYRVQLLERNVEILRQDRNLYDRRVGVMIRELADRRDWLNEEGERMAIAAAVMRDAPTLRRLRAEIETYIALDDPTRQQSRSIRWPAQALMRMADPADVALLERLDAKSPDDMSDAIDYMRKRITDQPERLRDEPAPKNR